MEIFRKSQFSLPEGNLKKLTTVVFGSVVKYICRYVEMLERQSRDKCCGRSHTDIKIWLMTIPLHVVEFSHHKLLSLCSICILATLKWHHNDSVPHKYNLIFHNTNPLLQHFKPPQQETSLMRPSTGCIPTGAWRRAHLAPINRVQNKIIHVLNLLSSLQMMTKQFCCVEIHVTVTRKST